MKKQTVLFLAIILGVAIIWWLLVHPTRKSIEVSTTNSPQSTAQSAVNSLATIKQQSQPSPIVKNTANDELKDYVEKLRQDPNYEWKLPINFFGRVVDDSNQPISSADIHFGWNTADGSGIISDETLDGKSDESGLFELHDKKGDPLQVSVSKQGYYSRNGTFWYSPNRGPFRPDPNNPYIFQLRKKGPGVDLVTSQYGISPDFGVSIPRHGIPIKIDLMQRKEGDSGQMVVTEDKPEYKDWQQATQWSFKIEIPGGGFIGENDEFPFEAPADGYQSVIEFDFQKNNLNWETGIKTNFYIEFGNPPLYGRLQIQTGIYMGGATLTYAINPGGLRNLERQNKAE